MLQPINHLIKILIVLCITSLLLYKLLYKIDYILLFKRDIINIIISNLLTVFSIFFSFLLVLADKLTNIDNINSKTQSEKKYFLNEIFENRKFKILYHFYILLVTIILLVGGFLIYNTKYIFLTFIFVICSFLSSFDMLNKIIFINKKQIENDINNNLC